MQGFPAGGELVLHRVSEKCWQLATPLAFRMAPERGEAGQGPVADWHRPQRNKSQSQSGLYQSQVDGDAVDTSC